MAIGKSEWFNHFPFGYGLHKLILNESGHAVDFEILEFNACYCEVLGIKLDQNEKTKRLTYKNTLFKHSKNHFLSPAMLEDVAIKGQTLKSKVYVEAFRRWVEVHFYSPEKYYFVAILQKEIQKFDLNLQALFEQNNDGIIMMDLEGHFIAANNRVAQMLGYDKESLLKLSFKNISGEVESTRCVMESVLAGVSVSPYERKFIKKDGTYLYVEINLELIYDDNQKPHYFQSVIRDISERKKIELDWMRLNKVQKLISTIASSLVKVNHKNYDLRINGVLKTLIHNFSIDRIAVTTFDAQIETAFITHIVSREGYHTQFGNHDTINLMGFPYWRGRTCNGETVWIEASKFEQMEDQHVSETLKKLGMNSVLSIPFFEDRKVVGAIILETGIASKTWENKDIHFFKVIAHMVNDARKRYESEIALMEAISVSEEANKAKTQFLANMSHEVRTPLNGILGFLDLMSETNLTETQLFYVHHARESGHSLLSIVNDLLDISKIEAGKLILESLKVDLPLMLESLIENMKILAQKKNIDVMLETIGNMPKYIWIDPTRLRQVLVNLLNNGIKFTESGSVVLKVTFVEDNKRFGNLTFRVIDTGIGIGSESSKTIFKAFAQGDLSTTRKYGGTGLGLTISSKIVEQMNGKLEFVSELGEGSQFFFTIKVPFLYDEAIRLSEAVGDAASQMDSLSTDIRILIVEDMEVNRLLLKKILEKQYPRMRILEATSGVDAVELFKKMTFDMVIMDVQMPKMDGLEATRCMRKIDYENKTHTPIVALSASALEEEKQKCFLVGMDDFVSKPIDKEVLFRVINTYLKRKL